MNVRISDGRERDQLALPPQHGAVVTPAQLMKNDEVNSPKRGSCMRTLACAPPPPNVIVPTEPKTKLFAARARTRTVI